MTVDILGTPYAILTRKREDDPRFKDNICGYCDEFLRRIVLCDLKTHEEWKDETPEKLEICRKLILRHEIVYAFLNESGLRDNAGTLNAPWPMNEEMVDWFAIQGPKIMKAWKEAGCLEGGLYAGV